MNFDYANNTQQPSLTQLQPVKNNNDPLYIFLGNPNLRPETNQSWKLMLTSSKTWLYNLSLDFELNSNNISTKTITDSLGRQISQPVNVDGGRNLGLNFSINKKIGGIDVGMMTNLTYSRNVNYINADLSRNDSYTSSGGFKIGQYVADKYSFQLDTKFTYFDNRSSINTTAPIHYWSQSHTGALSLFIIPGIELTTNANYTWQQANSVFAKSTSVLLWNASVGHNFLSNRLALKFLANNLLNQNSGISRTNLGNVNTESSTNILGQYWLLSLTYRFDHKYKRK
jgi:outer membrane receptor protein involved in Fe transport